MKYEKLRKIAIGMIFTGGLIPPLFAWFANESTKSIFEWVACISSVAAMVGLGIYAFAMWKL